MKGSLVVKQHVVMIYRFTGMRRAYDFQNLVIRCGVPASAKFAEHYGWYVQTDSRCLAHATKLAPFIYKTPKAYLKKAEDAATGGSV